MRRTTSVILTAALVLILAACNGSSGGLGSVPSAAPTPSPDGQRHRPHAGPQRLDEPIVGTLDGAERRPRRVRDAGRDDRRDDDRARLFRARRRARQRRAGARPAGGPQERGSRHRGDERAAGRTDGQGSRRPDHHDGDPRRDRTPRRDDQERRRDGEPVDRVRLGRRDGFAAVPPRAGRLHADPVHDHQVGRVPDRGRDRDGLRQRRDRRRRSGRPRRLHGPAARHLRRPAGVRRRDRQSGQGERQRRRVRGDVPGRDPRRGRARRSSTSR